MHIRYACILWCFVGGAPNSGSRGSYHLGYKGKLLRKWPLIFSRSDWWTSGAEDFVVECLLFSVAVWCCVLSRACTYCSVFWLGVTGYTNDRIHCSKGYSWNCGAVGTWDMVDLFTDRPGGFVSAMALQCRYYTPLGTGFSSGYHDLLFALWNYSIGRGNGKFSLSVLNMNAASECFCCRCCCFSDWSLMSEFTVLFLLSPSQSD